MAEGQSKNAHMPAQYDLTTSPITRDFAAKLLDLSVAVFGDDDRLDGSWRLQNMPDLLSSQASHNRSHIIYRKFLQQAER